jgi:uncharacterized repeat protein (TIGR01451 family)
MNHIPRSLRPIVLASTLALVAGCESLYEGPSRNTGERYTFRGEDPDRSATAAREVTSDDNTDRATYAAAEQRRATDVPASRSESSSTRTGGAAGATRSVREGDKTRFSMAYPTGERNSSVMLVEKTLPSQVRVGQPFEYDIKVTNLTDATLDDVRIQEQTPEGLAITASQPERQGQGADAGWQIGALKPRESRSIKVSGRAERQGELGTCLFASYKPSLCAAVNVVNPQIRVTKTAPDQADICQDIVYRYSVTNTGTGSTERVTVRDDLPEGLTTQDGRNQVVLDAGRIDAGQTKEAQVKLKAARAGSFASRAIATADGGLTAQTDEVSTRITQPKLGVNIEGPESEYVERAISYRVTVTNDGDSPARDATVAVNLPQAAKLANVGTQGRSDGRAIQWALGTLDPRASKTVTFTLAGTQEGALEASARAHAACAADVTDTASTRVMTIPALVLEAVDLSDPVRVGENVVYRISVRNQGSGADHNIRITASLPAEEQFISVKGVTDGQNSRADNRDVVKFAPVATLAPGRTAEWEVTAKANQAGDVRFEVQLESDSLSKPANETEPTRLY